MKKHLPLVLTTLAIFFSACSSETDNKNNNNTKSEVKQLPGFVLVEGGDFKNTKSNLYGKRAAIPDFYIGKYEVTQKEWAEVMGSNPSNFKGEDLPVEMVTWYDCIEFCNKKSIKEGLAPFYNIDKAKKDPANKCDIDSTKWIVTINPGSNGYRLPTEAEWEYAASGGQLSKNYSYSGSNDIDEVAWYWQNSGDALLTGSWIWSTLENNKNRTWPVGSKKPNELGIYDMSGNVREWCEEWYEDYEIPKGVFRTQRGGGWMGPDFRCEQSNRDNFEPSGKGPDQGLRLCRSIN